MEETNLSLSFNYNDSFIKSNRNIESNQYSYCKQMKNMK